MDHRSFKRQNSDYLPTIHLGYKAMALEKKGIKTDKGNYNREIKKHNSLVDIVKHQFKNISSWIEGFSSNLCKVEEIGNEVFNLLLNKLNINKNKYLNKKKDNGNTLKKIKELKSSIPSLFEKYKFGFITKE